MRSYLDIAAEIESASAEPYLLARGWELMHQGELGNRWRLRREDHVRNVAVPLLMAEPADRARMLSTVLAVLAEVEQRDPAIIAQDLSNAPFDVLEFRLAAQALTNGEMPLHAAPELTSGALEAMQAAARSEVSRRAHYAQGTLPAPVRSFVHEAVLAGTDRGSVILRVRAPEMDEPSQRAFDTLPGPEGFQRRAVRRLLAGMRAAKTASHRDPAGSDLDTYDEDIESGLSANLCDALIKLSGDKAGLEGRVAVRVRWALTHPAAESTTEVSIERSEIGQLPRVAAVLKEIDPQPNVTIRGPVLQIRREPGDPTGAIQVLAELDGKVRTVRLELDHSDYEIAYAAHGQDREIRATGTIERAGTSRELVNPTEVSLGNHLGPASRASDEPPGPEPATPAR